MTDQNLPALLLQLGWGLNILQSGFRPETKMIFNSFILNILVGWCWAELLLKNIFLRKNRGNLNFFSWMLWEDIKNFAKATDD